MNTDTIKWGENYDIAAAAQDANGDPITLDETWSAAIRVTLNEIGGPIILDSAMTIADGGATCSIDTGDSRWTAGTYFYDIRLTDADGNDQWSEAVRLTLENRNTPNT